MSKSIVAHAKLLIEEPLENYNSACRERDRALKILVGHIEEQDREIGDLKTQLQRFVDKLIDSQGT